MKSMSNNCKLEKTWDANGIENVEMKIIQTISAKISKNLNVTLILLLLEFVTIFLRNLISAFMSQNIQMVIVNWINT
jgi:hypothetical protein